MILLNNFYFTRIYPFYFFYYECLISVKIICKQNIGPTQLFESWTVFSIDSLVYSTIG
jgi:hypothetical protein